MSQPLFMAMLLVLCLAFLWITKFSLQRNTTKDEFFLGKRSLGLFPLTMTFFAAQIGGGALLGTAEEAYRFGWWALAYPLGLALGMLLLASGIGARLRELELVTVTEVFTRIYGSKTLRIVAGSLFVLSFFLILVAQCLAARKFLAALGYDSPYVFLGLWGVMLVYTSLGGLKAAVASDVLQGIVKLFALALIWFTAKESTLPALPAAFAPLTALPLFEWLLLPPLFMLIAQDMGQRCFAARSPLVVTQAALFSAFLFALVSIVPVYFGRQAQEQGIQIASGNSVFLSAIIQLTNPYAAAVSALGVVMALISIANSLLCSISSQISYDLPLFNRLSPNCVKALTAGIGALAALLSFQFSGVVSVLILSYELSVVVLFVPICAILMNRPLRFETCRGTMIVGAIAYFTACLVTLPLPKALFALTCTFSFAFISSCRKRFQNMPVPLI